MEHSGRTHKLVINKGTRVEEQLEFKFSVKPSATAKRNSISIFCHLQKVLHSYIISAPINPTSPPTVEETTTLAENATAIAEIKTGGSKWNQNYFLGSGFQISVPQLLRPHWPSLSSSSFWSSFSVSSSTAPDVGRKRTTKMVCENNFQIKILVFIGLIYRKRRPC